MSASIWARKLAESGYGSAVLVSRRSNLAPDSIAAPRFHTLLAHLATLARDDIVFADPAGVHIQKLTSPTPTQRRAFQLIQALIPLTLT
jgi:hypothetical protein